MSEQSNTRTEIPELPEQIDLFRILDGMWKAFRHYFWVPILFTLLGSALFFARARMNYVPQYLSSATFTVSADNQSIYNSSSYYNNTTASQLESTFPYLLTSGSLSRVVAADLGVEQLNGSITASVMPNTNLFTIEVRSGDPQAASDILNSVIENYPVVAEQVVGSTVLELLDNTGVADAPYNTPSYARTALKGGMLGLAAGVAFLFLVSFTRRTIQREDDFKQFLHAECLAVLPQVSLKKRSRIQRQDISIHNPHIDAAFLESMRILRTRLERLAGASGSKVLLVTSAAPGEGKSTIAANIAMALAMNGKKVLLIDCDIRNPSVGDLLGLQPGKGVYELLKGESKLEEVFQYDKSRSLYVLPGGKPYANASEILDAPQMAQLLSGFRELMDYVILDTAPLGMLTDTAVLAELADGALFVVKQDYAPIPHLVDAAEQLAESQIPLLGCILNGATATLGSYGQSYYSSYHHYSRYGGYGSRETETPARSKSRARSSSRQGS
ncbi:MAG: polysaccharide biosynthesis tyrosine autokinase [Candidatus Onthomonas sp.]